MTLNDIILYETIGFEVENIKYDDSIIYFKSLIPS